MSETMPTNHALEAALKASDPWKLAESWKAECNAANKVIDRLRDCWCSQCGLWLWESGGCGPTHAARFAAWKVALKASGDSHTPAPSA